MRLLRGLKSKTIETGQHSRRGLQFENLENRYLLASDLFGVIDPWSSEPVPLSAITQRAACDPFVPGELIVATKLSAARSSASSALAAIDWTDLTGLDTAKPIKTLMTVDQGFGQSAAMVQLKLGDDADILHVMRQLQGRNDVLWSTPNFVYGNEDPRDLIPNDPMFGSQYHHQPMGNVQAWDISLGSPGVLLGITDDGFDLQHQDLSAAIWTNPGEVPGDGIDNDANGYIDDVHGYNFLNNNNNPDALAGDDHGTHVAGIAAASINNEVGTVGTAAGVTVVPLKWYDGLVWTAAIIAETFAYAADNGVDIVNTSYNMDTWATDAVVHAAFDYLYDAGVLHFNSAGNSAKLNPPRQVFVESLLVASTDNGDGKSSFSNYGEGIDIAAPGGSILSTTPNNTYSVFSGTSMATPNAAAVAALIWSVHPTWSREQVAAQLLATADNIDAQNPSFVGLLGAGRVNSYRALSQDIGAPKIKSIVGLPVDGGTTTTLPAGFDLMFSQIMDPASVNAAANYELRSAGGDGVFDTSDDDLLTLLITDAYKIGTNRLHVAIPAGSSLFGNYRLSLLSGGLRNPFGTPLDGNGDGVGGDAYQTYFTLEPSLPTAIGPLGSLVYEQSLQGSINPANDTDSFSVYVDQGQTLTVLIEGSVELMPTVKVDDVAGNTLANVTATGRDAVTQVLAVADSGAYLVTVGSALGTSGTYSVRLLLNAAFESEQFGSGGNDTLPAAQDIDGSAIDLSGLGGTPAVDRLAVVGRLPSAGGDPVDGENFETGSLGSRWTTQSSHPLGRISVSNAFGAAAGRYALTMDVSANNNYSLNEAIWSVDLAGINSPTLSFYHAEWADEEQPLPATFTGSFNGDGVSISDDGVTWHRVFDPTTQATGVWVKQSIDLAAAASSAGISLGTSFQVKFQQYDNYSLATDGRGYDEIVISTSAAPDDWYSFTLRDGDRATIGATVTNGVGNLALELYDSSGNLLATGAAGSENVSSIIRQFQDATADGGADHYFVRVSGQDASYSLLVTRNVGFDTENNDHALQAQPLSGLRGVLGHASTQLEDSADVYSLGLVRGEQLTLAATLPAAGPFLFDNLLATPSGSALVMELRDPSGTLVGTDSTQIIHTADMTGDYTLTVFASELRGEYFIAINQTLIPLVGDFDNDRDYDCDDINALVAAIAGNTGDLLYDLSADGQLTLDDVDGWLALAGAANLPSGSPYLPGDATLDGLVDGNDFLVWNANKFTSTGTWCLGDFNADGATDGGDFIIWNENKFNSAMLAIAQPPEQREGPTAKNLAATNLRALAAQSWPAVQPQSSVQPQASIAAYLPAAFELASLRRASDAPRAACPSQALVDAVFADPLGKDLF